MLRGETLARPQPEERERGVGRFGFAKSSDSETALRERRDHIQQSAVGRDRVARPGGCPMRRTICRLKLLKFPAYQRHAGGAGLIRDRHPNFYL